MRRRGLAPKNLWDHSGAANPREKPRQRWDCGPACSAPRANKTSQLPARPAPVRQATPTANPQNRQQASDSTIAPQSETVGASLHLHALVRSPFIRLTGTRTPIGLSNKARSAPTRPPCADSGRVRPAPFFFSSRFLEGRQGDRMRGGHGKMACIGSQERPSLRIRCAETRARVRLAIPPAQRPWAATAVLRGMRAQPTRAMRQRPARRRRAGSQGTMPAPPLTEVSVVRPVARNFNCQQTLTRRNRI